MVLTWVIQHLPHKQQCQAQQQCPLLVVLKKTHPRIHTHLHQFHHIRMVELLEDGDLLVHPLQGAFGLRGTLRSTAGPSGRRSSYTCRNVHLRLPSLTAQVHTHPYSPIRSPHRAGHLLYGTHLLGKPACRIKRFLDRTFIACGDTPEWGGGKGGRGKQK